MSRTAWLTRIKHPTNINRKEKVMKLTILSSWLCLFSLLILGCEKKNDSNQLTVTEENEHWPKIFNISYFKSLQNDIDSTDPNFFDDIISPLEVMQAYGYMLGQTLSVENLIEKYPNLRDELTLAYNEWIQTFGKSEKYIEDVIKTRMGDEWSEYKKDLVRSINEEIDFEKVSLLDAKEYISYIRKRSEGDIPIEILKTIITMQPDYIKNPGREMEDGYVNEYRTDGTGKSSSVIIGIEYPKSWEYKEGRRPHIVQTFNKGYRKGIEVSATLLINDYPEELKKLSPNCDIKLLQNNEFWDAFSSGTHTIDSGFVTIAGKEAIWGETISKTERLGNKVEGHSLSFAMVDKRNVVIVGFSVLILSEFTDENADDIFNQFGQVFFHMVNSIDFFDRYDDKNNKNRYSRK